LLAIQFGKQIVGFASNTRTKYGTLKLLA
jgi:hypothetical protein